MNNPSLLVPAAIATPMVCALLLLGGKSYWGKVVRGIAWAGFVVPAVLSLYLLFQYEPTVPGGYDFITRTDFGLEGLGITLHLGLNGVALPLFALAGVVGLAAGLYAIQAKAERAYQYLFLLLFMQSGLMGIFASIDVFFFYLFHEFALIPTFILVGIWGGRDRQYAAMKMTIYLTVGAMLSLAGLITLYVQSDAGSFDLVALREAIAAQPLSATVQKYAFALLLFGFGILVSLWPFHTWAPLGYGAAPSSAAMLHAGVLKKFGLYGLIQIALPLLPAGVFAWSSLLGWLALGNVVVVGFITISQRDVKQMIGYSSVMHMGYCFLGIATASVLGAGAAVLLMVAHGLSVALLFMLVTSIHHRTRTFDMFEMGGLVKKTPVLAGFFTTAIMASIAVPGPGLANFWGEFTVFLAIWNWKSWMLFPVMLGIVISAVYGLRSIGRIFFGKPTPAFEPKLEAGMVDLSWRERVPAIVLLVALIGLGIWPRLISDGVNASLESSLPQPAAEAQVARFAR
ncbi:MAG: complex I subunit 4 family protein [Opitutaceae bacterium]